MYRILIVETDSRWYFQVVLPNGFLGPVRTVQVVTSCYRILSNLQGVGGAYS